MNTPDSVTQRRVDIDHLDQAIVNLSAKINAASYELLVLIREFDERAGWLKWGLSNCTQWLHWRCDISLSTAREKIRVAHALKDLAEISVAFASGVLSYSKVRALTRVATTDNQVSLLEFAMTTTATRVEERCRQLRNVQPASTGQANRVHQNRSVKMWRNHERGTLTLTLEVPIEEGELIDQAISKAIQACPHQGPGDEAVSLGAQQADAWVRVAKTYLHGSCDANVSSADAYQVVVHVDQSALTCSDGRSDLPVETVKRLTCDGSVISMLENSQGDPLSVGRKRRTVSKAIHRALWARDKGCVFPGCTHTRFVDAHHVEHWADGGETNMNNLLLLCSRHHQLVHEGGYKIGADVRGDWYFRRDDGRAIPASGYLPDDMIDDELDQVGILPIRNPSAEGFERELMQHELNEVREEAEGYWCGACAYTESTAMTVV